MTDAEWNAAHGNPEDNAHLEPKEQPMTLEEATARVEAARKAALEPKPDPEWWAWEDAYQQDCKNTNDNH